jgi:hypothetical protein
VTSPTSFDSSSLRKQGFSVFGFVFTSNAFAFGELLFLEGLQRKVTAPRKGPLALLTGAPPRAGLLICDVWL